MRPAALPCLVAVSGWDGGGVGDSEAGPRAARSVTLMPLSVAEWNGVFGRLHFRWARCDVTIDGYFGVSFWRNQTTRIFSNIYAPVRRQKSIWSNELQPPFDNFLNFDDYEWDSERKTQTECGLNGMRRRAFISSNVEVIKPESMGRHVCGTFTSQ